MFVVVDRSRFERLVAVTRDDRTRRLQARDQPFYRIEASGELIRLSGRQVEVTVPATVHEPGVLFLRVTIFRKALALLPDAGFLAIQANAEGISFGDTRLSPSTVDMLLYADPATAPMLHPEERGLPEQIPAPREMSLFGSRKRAYLDKHPTTEPGYINPNDQRNDGSLDLPGTDHNQTLYRMTCTKCLTVYAANGSDIHHRKCPKCQGGAPSSGGWKA